MLAHLDGRPGIDGIINDIVGDDVRLYKNATLHSQLLLEALPLAFVPTVTGKGRR
jgi:hypothetical protein